MAGAHYGVDEIPRRWLDGLQSREGIERRAIALAHRSADGLAVPDLVATEVELNARERALLACQGSLSRGDRGANQVI